MLSAAPLQLFKLVILLLLSLPRMDMLAHFLEIEGDTIANARHSYRHFSIPLAVKGHLFSTTHPTSPPKEKSGLTKLLLPRQTPLLHATKISN
jgi:hypothetical protein